MKKKLLNLFYLLFFSGLLIIVYLPIRLLYQVPDETGNIAVPGLSGKVEVYRDVYGIPHIFGYNKKDTYFALGYIQASERLFQIQMLKRVIAGRFSEVVGKEGLVVDKTFRTLGFRRNFSHWLSKKRLQLDPKNMEIIDSFLEGVNTFARIGTKPLEMQILGIDVEPLEKEDMLGLLAYISYSFSEPYLVEPALHILEKKIGTKKIKELRQVNNTSNPKTNHNLYTQINQFLLNQIKVKEILSDFGVPIFHGSNSWAISKKRSKSGNTILANDPHMHYSTPGLWFEAYINYPGFELYGQFLPLSPFALIGFNSNLGWGMTIFPYDDVDFYMEKVNPTNPNQVLFEDKIIDLRIREEVIHVHNSEDIIWKIKESHNGPIINDIIPSLEKTQSPISLKWQVFSENNNPIAFFSKLNSSNSIEDVQEALPYLKSPGLRLTYADKSGNISQHALIGFIERDFDTGSILPGNVKKYQWGDTAPFSKNPGSQNPEKGIVYSTNNQPENIEIPGYWQPDDRWERLKYLFQKQEKFSFQEMKDFISDTEIEVAKLIQKSLIHAVKIHKNLLESKELEYFQKFRKWNFRADPESIEMSIFSHFYYFLTKEIFYDEMDEEIFKTLGKTSRLQAFLKPILLNHNNSFWDNIHTKEVETEELIYIHAWKKAMKDIRFQYGKNESKWKWKNLNQLELVHPLGKIWPLNYVYNLGPASIPGGRDAINNQISNFSKNDHKPVFGPSFRMIVEFSDITKFSMIQPSGNSGHVLSKHYDDQFHMFVQSKLRTNSLSRIREKKEKNFLILSPKRMKEISN